MKTRRHYFMPQSQAAAQKSENDDIQRKLKLPDLKTKIERAYEHRQAGRLAEAETLCRQVLAQEPSHSDALNLLGALASRAGQPDLAAELFQRALACDAGNAESYANLAAVLQAGGKLEAAKAACLRAVQLGLDSASTQNTLGNIFFLQGRYLEAIAAYRRAVSLDPAFASGHFNLGMALEENHQIQESIAAYGEACRLDPSHAVAQYNLGHALQLLGRVDEAINAYREAIGSKPDFVTAYRNLAYALQTTGRFEEASAFYRRALDIEPDSAEVYNNLGVCLKDQGKTELAIDCLRKAISLQPNSAEAHSNLGTAFQIRGQLDLAVAAFQDALRLKPDSADFHNNLANCYKDQGRTELAVQHFRRAVLGNPAATQIHSNLVYTLHFHPDYDASAIFAEARQWNRQHALPLQRYIQTHPNDRSPDRRLRIGYVSPDFRHHVVGSNLVPLLRERDPAQFEIFCYSDVSITDSLTTEIQNYSDHWRNVVGLADDEVARIIRADGIDILVDLTMHMAGNRLPLFARKPAPLQVTYLAYCGTTGLDAIDYRISDPYFDPPGEPENWYSEKTVRLRASYWCYQPPPFTPEVSPLPVSRAGFVTFGCLNNFAKVSDRVLDLWIKILRALPESRMLLHASEGTCRQMIVAKFAEDGIEAARLEFVGKQSWSDYVATWQRIDIGLDPFPYGGGITTCDALWMGVPVVTLFGRTAVGRGGCSILANLGLQDLIAGTPEQYLEIAVSLAQDIPKLDALRGSLRDRIERSPLRDAVGFARDMERVYREIWTGWCVSVK